MGLPMFRNGLARLRPNIVLLCPYVVIKEWSQPVQAAAVDVAVMVIHGDSNRAPGKLSTSAGDMFPKEMLSIVKDAKVRVLLQCFTAADCIESIRQFTETNRSSSSHPTSVTTPTAASVTAITATAAVTTKTTTAVAATTATTATTTKTATTTTTSTTAASPDSSSTATTVSDHQDPKVMANLQSAENGVLFVDAGRTPFFMADVLLLVNHALVSFFPRSLS
jgi:hypothetical protein